MQSVDVFRLNGQVLFSNQVSCRVFEIFSFRIGLVLNISIQFELCYICQFVFNFCFTVIFFAL